MKEVILKEIKFNEQCNCSYIFEEVIGTIPEIHTMQLYGHNVYVPPRFKSGTMSIVGEYTTDGFCDVLKELTFQGCYIDLDKLKIYSSNFFTLTFLQSEESWEFIRLKIL